MEENLKHNKLPYQPPVLELFEYVVEHGFAKTSTQTMQMDTWSQITYDRRGGQDLTGTYDKGNNNFRGGYDAGENYHGEWY